MDKTDCFAYVKKGYCAALKKQECDNCSFYKKGVVVCDKCNLKGTLACKECKANKKGVK